MSLGMMIRAQFELQRVMPPVGRDVTKLKGAEFADYVRVNVLALEDELHEAMQEVVWKPWSHAEPGFIDRDRYLDELIDAWHFFMNLVLVAKKDDQRLGDLVNEFTERYFAKHDRNRQRQAEGYTGLDKCPNCKRELVPGQECPCAVS
jgi:hypothetical protein